MEITKAKAILIGALVVAGIALPVRQHIRLQRLQSQNPPWRADQRALAAVHGEPKRQRTERADHAELEPPRQTQEQIQRELPRSRGMAGVARQADAEAKGLPAQPTVRAPDPATNPMPGPVGDSRGNDMKVAVAEQVEGQLSRMTTSLQLTPEQAQAARDILTRWAQEASAEVQRVFSGLYNPQELVQLVTEAGIPEAQIMALLTPEQQAAYSWYREQEAARNARLAANSEWLQLQSALGVTPDQEEGVIRALFHVNYNELTDSSRPAFTNQAAGMEWLLAQKARALESVLTPAQLEGYRRQQEQQLQTIRSILPAMPEPGKNP